MNHRQKRGGAGRLGTEFAKRASSGKMIDRTQPSKHKGKVVVTIEAGNMSKFFIPVGERL